MLGRQILVCQGYLWYCVRSNYLDADQLRRICRGPGHPCSQPEFTLCCDKYGDISDAGSPSC